MAARRPKTFADVLTMGLCQYITGDPKKSPVFCRQKPKEGSAYCEQHHAICHAPQPEKKKNDIE